MSDGFSFRELQQFVTYLWARGTGGTGGAGGLDTLPTRGVGRTGDEAPPIIHAFCRAPLKSVFKVALEDSTSRSERAGGPCLSAACLRISQVNRRVTVTIGLRVSSVLAPTMRHQRSAVAGSGLDVDHEMAHATDQAHDGATTTRGRAGMEWSRKGVSECGVAESSFPW